VGSAESYEAKTQELALLLLFSYCIHFTFAVTGVDISQGVSEADFACLKNLGRSFAVTRAYQSIGRVDPNAVANIEHARAAGIAYVDAYLFPCVPCGNAAAQMDATINGLGSTNYGMIWLDIERLSWSSDLASNRNFISALIAAGKAKSKTIGVYTNYNNWAEIVGIDWNGAADLPLWYAHYDNSPSFSDFTPFGGWTKPAIKQYAGDVSFCSAGWDKSWY